MKIELKFLTISKFSFPLITEHLVLPCYFFIIGIIWCLFNAIKLLNLIPKSVLKRGPDPLRKCVPPLKINCSHSCEAISDVSGSRVKGGRLYPAWLWAWLCHLVALWPSASYIFSSHLNSSPEKWDKNITSFIKLTILRDLLMAYLPQYFTGR